MEALELNYAIFAGFGQTCAWLCPAFSKITKCQYLWEWWSYFVYLLHVVTHPWKQQCYHFVLGGYGLACPVFSEITSFQSL